MYRVSDLQAVVQANRQYMSSKAKTDAEKEALFDTWVAAAMSGYSPEEIAQSCDFSAVYIRRVVRERGVEPSSRGPKPKK